MGERKIKGIATHLPGPRSRLASIQSRTTPHPFTIKALRNLRGRWQTDAFSVFWRSFDVWTFRCCHYIQFAKPRELDCLAHRSLYSVFSIDGECLSQSVLTVMLSKPSTGCNNDMFCLTRVSDEWSGHGPVFEEQPIDTIYPEESPEDKITLMCRARAHPPATYRWQIQSPD